MVSLHHEASTPVHALPAGAKLSMLFVVGAGAFFVRSLAVLGAVLGGVVLCYVVARIPGRVAVRQMFTILPVMLIICGAQLLVTGWGNAVLVAGRILVLLLLANLITFTTRTSAMVSAVEKMLGPFRRFGVRPELVGLVIAMTIRFIPVIKDQADQVRDAQRARGIQRSTAFLTPLLIKTLRLADGLGEALDARGVGIDARESRRTRRTLRG
jgi:biotin transport system permease protein